MARKPYDPAAEGAAMAFAGRMSYGDYLRLEQNPRRAGAAVGCA